MKLEILQITEANENAVSGQLAFRIPIGAASSAGVGRYRALRHGQVRDAERISLEQTRAGLQALDAIRRFELDTSRWQELLELAREADRVAEDRWQSRLATPERVADLFDEALDARLAVLEARAGAGLASCQLLSATGVSAADWPRGPVLAQGLAQDEPRGRLEEGGTLPRSATPLTPLVPLVSDGYLSNPPR